MDSVKMEKSVDGITPSSSVPTLAIAWPVGPAATLSEKPPAQKQPKKETSRWILFWLWFNTYRKFFVFTTLLNLVGIILACLGKFP